MRTVLFFLVGAILGSVFFTMLRSSTRSITENRPNISFVELERRVHKLQDRVDYLEYEVEKYSNIWAVLTRRQVSIYSQ